MGDSRNRGRSAPATAGNAIYGLGIFGAWVWFWTQASGFWEHLFAILEGFFWPAFVVYYLLERLAG
ncbi:MAG: hypothetical protein U0R80_18895 [Nocardioidaceae bacterium]